VLGKEKMGKDKRVFCLNGKPVMWITFRDKQHHEQNAQNGFDLIQRKKRERTRVRMKVSFSK